MSRLPLDAAAQERKDIDHLNMLAIFHYVMAGLNAVGGCISVVYIVIGVGILIAAPAAKANEPPPAVLGGMFAGMGSCMFLMMAFISAATIYSGRCLHQRKNRMFSLVVAALMCLSIPLGTILGVFTLVVLSRDSVVRLYEKSPP